MTISELTSLTPDVASKMSDAEIIKAGKSAQKFVNQRLNQLEKANIRTKVTSGGARKSSLKRINSRIKAEKAILQAKEMESNPLGTPGKIHKMMKESGLTKNPKTGKWSAKQTKDFLKRNQAQDFADDGWEVDEIFTTLDEFFEWARVNHPEWKSKQVKALYQLAVEEYHVDPIKFWSADYKFRKTYYDENKQKKESPSKEMSSDDLLSGDFTDVDDMFTWEEEMDI